MIYMMANNTGAWKLRKSGFPMGWLMGYQGWKKPEKDGHKPMPYALDNGMYFPFGGQPHGMDRICEFLGRCGRAMQFHKPEFAVVPDMPYDAAETIARYKAWHSVCRTIAPDWRWGVAVQDGMGIGCVESIGIGEDPSRQAVCVGGSSEWKDKTIAMWAKFCRQRGVWCHVLRVNDERRLRLCQDEGVDSVDGTGIFRGDQQQKKRVLWCLVQGGLFETKERAA